MTDSQFLALLTMLMQVTATTEQSPIGRFCWRILSFIFLFAAGVAYGHEADYGTSFTTVLSTCTSS